MSVLLLFCDLIIAICLFSLAGTIITQIKPERVIARDTGAYLSPNGTKYYTDLTNIDPPGYVFPVYTAKQKLYSFHCSHFPSCAYEFPSHYTKITPGVNITLYLEFKLPIYANQERQIFLASDRDRTNYLALLMPVLLIVFGVLLIADSLNRVFIALDSR